MKIINVVTIQSNDIRNIDSFIVSEDAVVHEANEHAVSTAIELSLGEDEYIDAVENNPELIDELREGFLENLDNNFLDCGMGIYIQLVESYTN